MTQAVDTKKPHNPITGTVYSGSNVERLQLASECKEWATFLQWHTKGFKIRKGEKGTLVYYFSEETKTDKKTGKLKVVGGARQYTVFNRTQVEAKEEHDV